MWIELASVRVWKSKVLRACPKAQLPSSVHESPVNGAITGKSSEKDSYSLDIRTAERKFTLNKSGD